MELFGFSLYPLKSLIILPIYMVGYTVANVIMNFSRTGMALSFIFNILGQQMTISWKIGKIIEQ
jgi:hypothetical protein